MLCVVMYHLSVARHVARTVLAREVVVPARTLHTRSCCHQHHHHHVTHPHNEDHIIEVLFALSVFTLQNFELSFDDHYYQLKRNTLKGLYQTKTFTGHKYNFLSCHSANPAT